MTLCSRLRPKAADEAGVTSDMDGPLPTHVRVTRGHPRAKNLQVRFRDNEYDELAAYAEHRGLPVSTVVRMLVLQAIAPADERRDLLFARNAAPSEMSLWPA